MIREAYILFCDMLDSIWIGIMYGVRIAVAAVIVFWMLKGLTGWAAMLKAVVQ